MLTSEYKNRTIEDTISTVREIITTQIINQPRLLQEMIGPLEVGNPCTKCLARRLAYGRKQHAPGEPVPWALTIGTGAHALFEEFFHRHNQTQHATDRTYRARFIMEEKVTVGALDGKPITGSTDLVDLESGTTVDWKFVGPAQLTKYRTQGPSHQYRVQAHLYGLGWTIAGARIDTVAICFLPRAGNDFSAHHWWHEPFDPRIAADALTRLEGVWHAVKHAPNVEEHIAQLASDPDCYQCSQSTCPAMPITGVDMSGPLGRLLT